jgi:hypothetical protein
MLSRLINWRTMVVISAAIPFVMGANAGAAKVITQGGNKNIKATMVIGQATDYGINFITDNATVMSLSSSGQATFKAATNSTAAFQIQNAAGSNLFTANTTNGYVGIGTATPNYPLDVNGAVNTNTGYYVDGVQVCNASGCMSSGGGSNAYIQNSTSNQLANIAIQSATPSSPTVSLRGTPGQAANLLQVQSSTGTNVFSVAASGALTVQPSNTTVALQVDTASDQQIFAVNTVNNILVENAHIESGNANGITKASIGSGAGGGSVKLTGDDTAGTITITTGTTPTAGNLATLTFANTYGSTPNVILSPDNFPAANIGYYANSVNTSGFSIDSVDAPTPSATYVFSYYVVN